MVWVCWKRPWVATGGTTEPDEWFRSLRVELWRGVGTVQIGELAERTGASRRSIRYYEQQGLLAPLRMSNGWREYDELAVNRVLNLRELLSAGLVLDDIRQVSPCLDMKTVEFLACDYPDDGTIAMYERRLSELDTKAAELQRYRTELVDRIARLRASASDAEEFASLLRSQA